LTSKIYDELVVEIISTVPESSDSGSVGNQESSTTLEAQDLSVIKAEIPLATAVQGICSARPSSMGGHNAAVLFSALVTQNQLELVDLRNEIANLRKELSTAKEQLAASEKIVAVQAEQVRSYSRTRNFSGAFITIGGVLLAVATNLYPTAFSTAVVTGICGLSSIAIGWIFSGTKEK
jgi:hypothetical protein